MRAIHWTAYGSADVLQLREVATPSPRDNEILIRIRAAAVTMGDIELRSLTLPLWVRLPIRLFMGYRRPTRRKIPGAYLAGEIEAVGKDVTRFEAGDRVFAASGFTLGAYAEYLCLPEEGAIALKPADTDYEEAAAVPLGGLNALHFITKAAIEPGERVLINGAGGSIGTYAVQLAKHSGAEVTGVDSAVKFEHLRSLGADHVIDYRREDFTGNGKSYDVILDVVGTGSLARSLRSLEPGGRFLMANPRPAKVFRGLLASRTSSKRVIIEAAAETAEGLVALRELIEAGTLKPVVDRRFPLAQAAEAHRYLESGAKVGDVVITP